MNLRTPGPIPVPEDILESMSWQMINHRGPEYKDLLFRTTEGVKRVFETKNDLYIMTSSGTGAMEAAIVNTLSPGDKVVNVCVGVFGERFGEIAELFGAEVISLDFEYGTAADPDKIRETLSENPDVKAVLVTHNETSTGVTNDLQAIAAVVKGEFDKLLLVDGISSVCSIPISTDAWDCDVVATASQKGWMLPPGLAFISFSERAWEAHAEAKMPRYYFDMAMYKRYYEIGQPPYTPAISRDVRPGRRPEAHPGRGDGQHIRAACDHWQADARRRKEAGTHTISGRERRFGHCNRGECSQGR